MRPLPGNWGGVSSIFGGNWVVELNCMKVARDRALGYILNIYNNQQWRPEFALKLDIFGAKMHVKITASHFTISSLYRYSTQQRYQEDQRS
jgi:hypothetical protein